MDALQCGSHGGSSRMDASRNGKMVKFFEIIFDELGMVAGTITIVLVSHAILTGICLLAYVALH